MKPTGLLVPHHRGPRARARLDRLDSAVLDRPDVYAPSASLWLTDLELDLPDALVAAFAQMAEGDPAEAPEVALPEGEIPWRATVMMADTDTGDGRHFESAGGAHRDLPLPLMANLQTTWAHEGAFLAGRIETLTLGSPEIPGSGVFADTDEARLVAAHIAVGNLRGISADLDSVIAEYEATEYDDDGFPIDYLYRASEWRIMGATVTPFPAFAECSIELDSGDAAADDGSTESDASAAEAADDRERIAVAASAPAATAGELHIPVQPPRSWLVDPELDELTAPVFSTEGCFGHLAPWDECHVGFADVCTCAPHSEADYAYMHTGGLVCDDGETVSVGQITLGGGHADLGLDARAAVAHYDESGIAVADVCFGEDEHGIWFAGALRPTVTPEQLRELQCSALSGDWRPIGGRLELIAALTVNVPGFPVPRARTASATGGDTMRPRARIADGHVTALVASAGAVRVARLVAQRGRFVPLAEHAAALARIEAMETKVGQLMGHFEPELVKAARARIA